MTTSINLNLRQDELIRNFYERSKYELLGYVVKRIGSRMDAEDLMQDVFCRLLNYNTLLNEQMLQGLIYKIARNLIVDYYRHNACTMRAQEFFANFSTDRVNTTEETIMANEVERVESHCINQLTKQRGQIYTLCSKEGFSAEEIASQLGLSQRTIENHLFMARKEIRSLVSSFY